MLRLAREQARMTLEGAARDLEWSRAKMYRIEGGHTSMRSHDVRTMCSLYGAEPDMVEVMVSLAKESKAKGWWHSYADQIPEWFELYVGLESAASRLRQYEPALIPGLLQTPEYARKVFNTSPGVTPEQVERDVALRMERQQLLSRRRPAPPLLEVILEEVALRRATPDMPAQLEALERASRQRGVRVRIVPTGVGLHSASRAGSFVILDFGTPTARAAEPSTVYSESLTGALYLDKPAEVDAYAGAWSELVALALTEEESRKLMHDLRESHA
ncbi:helix-turn-helix domain-containing protein [Micromonospora sp. NPDC048898]|uniref:helix-turn-helix domain-containing protein n=1 Tax=Micromonospora sp. NPDC048898 TaxID=3364260 RepID=UPI003713C198